MPIDASDEVSDEAIKRGDEFRTYIWGEKGIDVLLKSLSYVDYGKDLKRILFQFYIMPCDYERIHIKEIEQYRKNEKATGIPPDFVIVSPKILRQRVLLFSDVLPSALFGYKPPCSKVA